MRSYLVVMDEPRGACGASLCARRAARTGGASRYWRSFRNRSSSRDGVQAAMEKSALRAEAMLVQASGAIIEEAGISLQSPSSRAIR